MKPPTTVPLLSISVLSFPVEFPAILFLVDLTGLYSYLLLFPIFAKKLDGLPKSTVDLLYRDGLIKVI